MPPRTARLMAAAGIALCGLSFWPAAAPAAEPAECRTVRMSDPGWTDITATTTTASVILAALGYQPSVVNLSVAVSIEGLRSKNIDAFLGNWMPAQEEMTRKYIDGGQIDVAAVNLEGATTTLAVNKAAADAGVKTFADLDKNAEKFKRTINSIEPGSSANAKIQKMIEDDAYGLGDWKLVESSEAAMLASVDRAVRRDEWAVFLGWAPHPMNVKLPMGYLDGGEEYFGPNRGSATVRTLTRAGLDEACPNLGTFLKQLVFSVPMENEMMVMILNDRMDPKEAVETWMRKNPQVLDSWLAGVTALDGKPGLPAVKSALGIAS
ncbi:choline ABC transporter substrate-binding protein [Skermanella sp. TT6]|uniref:Choline ABC transporter substrate-binding protein n=1 Tax=Skermanella cutis TaxID=2775420 RepID=A0ABX7BDT5_9PROT|nr:choline ABC transporter substrate-binding protein [Skermanella sp. TT6]QQP91755.1 choline ABC transporter substrate-binding protein [Skermanella sp. TT6]